MMCVMLMQHEETELNVLGLIIYVTCWFTLFYMSD